MRLPPTLDPFAEERNAWRVAQHVGGVTEIDREWPHVRYMTDAPSVHLHYWDDDEGTERRGWTVADLVCHGCNRATRLVYPASMLDEVDSLRPLRDEFVAAHREHVTIGGHVLCPPLYSITERKDLR